MSRQSRVTADITLEAHNILREYCDKHERSKGYLIEKMIRKFCVDVEPVKSTEIAVVKEKVKRFIRPTPAEICFYMTERDAGHTITCREEANKFYDFYESKGWVVGRNKMKCWKAAVRNWLKGAKEKSVASKDVLQDSADSDWHKQDQGF